MLYTYYGDDFTGSTDVLEQLGANGIPAVLFIGLPTPAHLAAFPHAKAIGIAGDARSRSPEWMSANLPGIFRTLQRFNTPITHYKVCSTFDSSATIGSIGRALEIGLEVFSPSFVPVVVAAPHLRRYVAFGNLFAGSPDGTIQRIDRHPMATHPVTPMREADLRLHLAAQTNTKIGLVDAMDLWHDPAMAVDALVTSGYRAAVFDTIDFEMQHAIGQLLWHRAQQRPLFCVGSSGLTAALVSAWDLLDLFPEPPPLQPPALAKPLLVVSGSCSAVTERQLRYALAHGYDGLHIDPATLLNPGGPAYTATLEAASQSLATAHDTILYTALGSPGSAAHGDLLGIALGNLLRELLSRSARSAAPVHRVLICGGDTSSQAVQQLGIHALSWVANIQPGGPLCRAHADSPLNGLELVLKGGQVGTEEFFDLVRGS